MNITLLIGAGALAAGFLAGSQVTSWRHNSAQLKAQEAATAKFKRDEKRVDVSAEAHEQFKAKEEIVYVDRERKIKVYIDRPVYRNVCIDDDGVRLINDAIAGREIAGEPAAAVPGSAAAPGR